VTTLRENSLVSLSREVVKENGIVQKLFFLATYHLVFYIDALPKEIAWYFYAQITEPARRVTPMHDLGSMLIEQIL
jgi:hypothetical protein